MQLIIDNSRPVRSHAQSCGAAMRQCCQANYFKHAHLKQFKYKNTKQQ